MGVTAMISRVFCNSLFGFRSRLLALAAAVAFLGLPLTVSAADVVYEYDDKGRLKSVTYTVAGKKIIYTYDKAGNRTQKVVQNI